MSSFIFFISGGITIILESKRKIKDILEYTELTKDIDDISKFLSTYKIGFINQLIVILIDSRCIATIYSPNKFLLNKAFLRNPTCCLQALHRNDIINKLNKKTCDKIYKAYPKIIDNKYFICSLSSKNKHIKLNSNLGIFNND